MNVSKFTRGEFDAAMNQVQESITDPFPEHLCSKVLEEIGDDPADREKVQNLLAVQISATTGMGGTGLNAAFFRSVDAIFGREFLWDAVLLATSSRYDRKAAEDYQAEIMSGRYPSFHAWMMVVSLLALAGFDKGSEERGDQ